MFFQNTARNFGHYDKGRFSWAMLQNMFCLMIMGIKIQDDHSSRDSIRLVDKENVANQLTTYLAIW